MFSTKWSAIVWLKHYVGLWVVEYAHLVSWPTVLKGDNTRVASLINLFCFYTCVWFIDRPTELCIFLHCFIWAVCMRLAVKTDSVTYTGLDWLNWTLSLTHSLWLRNWTVVQISLSPRKDITDSKMTSNWSFHAQEKSYVSMHECL